MATKVTGQKRKASAAPVAPTKKAKISQPAAPLKSALKKTKVAKISQKEPEDINPVLPAADSDSEDIEPSADQTVALLQGFESDSPGSESGSADSDNGNDDNSKPLDISLLPDPSAAISKDNSDASAPADTRNSEPTGPTVVYISRIPHGFHEPQMKAYFTQFGDVARLRLARNRRTGRSRHFAFVQFAVAEVADIVARTMNNYLLFGHLLKCRIVAWEDVARMGGAERIFCGGGRRFKKIPWNKIERNRLHSTDREGWKGRIKGEQKRRKGKMAKLKELGYEFTAPEIRDVESVPVKAVAAGEGAQKALENGVFVSKLAEIEATPAVELAENGASKEGSLVVSGDKQKKASKKNTKKRTK